MVENFQSHSRERRNVLELIWLQMMMMQPDVYVLPNCEWPTVALIIANKQLLPIFRVNLSCKLAHVVSNIFDATQRVQYLIRTID